MRPTVTASRFGVLPDGRVVDAYTLAVAEGLRARVLTLGATLQALEVPDHAGRLVDVVLGFDTVEAYLASGDYVGVTVGRVAGRIGGSRFTLAGTPYVLDAGGPAPHLHGGQTGFHQRCWAATPFEEPAAAGVALRLTSPDGEGGYPGALAVEVRYTLRAGALHMTYAATATRLTPVSLTNHAYFNLAGHDQGDVGGHHLQLQAAHYLPVDEALVPLGHRAPVAGTPFDFRRPHALGARRMAPHPQLRHAGGYDHAFVRDPAGPEQPVAVLHDPARGRRLQVYTASPCLQLYGGQKLQAMGKGGVTYRPHSGVCLEAMGYPDALNHPAFPTTLAAPDEPYTATITYALDTV